MTIREGEAAGVGVEEGEIGGVLVDDGANVAEAAGEVGAQAGEGAADEAGVDTGGAAAAPWRASLPWRALGWCRAHLVATCAVAAVLASAAAAASAYWWLYRPDLLTDQAVREQVVAAAREGTEALLTYSPERLDADLSAAKSHLTAGFLNEYTELTDKVVAPASREKGVKTEASASRAAISSIRPGEAEVLVFVNQVSTSNERPTPALSASAVLVTLVQHGDRWLISAFAPI